MIVRVSGLPMSTQGENSWKPLAMKEAVAAVAQMVESNMAAGPWRARSRNMRSLSLRSTRGFMGISAMARIRLAAAARVSQTATSAATAAKESWKLAPISASGSKSRMTKAASARLRMLKACRSNSTAPSMIRVM